MRSRPKACLRRLTLRAPAVFARCQTFKSQSSMGPDYWCDLVRDRAPKRFCADSHDARLLGSTAAKPSNRRPAWGTFTCVILSAIASQSVFAQTHMTLACLARPNQRVAWGTFIVVTLSAMTSQGPLAQTHMTHACSNHKIALGTFSLVTLFAIASQTVFAQTHMTHACLARLLQYLQVAELHAARLSPRPCLRSRPEALSRTFT